MTAWWIILATNCTLYALFSVWWCLRLPQLMAKIAHPTYEDFQRIISRPFGWLYIASFCSHLAIASKVPHPWSSPWAQFIIFGMGSIAITYFFQTILLFRWHQRLTGSEPSVFIRSALAYLRLTAALLAPFFIYQVLNTTLFDPPSGRIDAVEIIVFNVGRMVILSLLTIIFSVIFMLRMVPNTPVSEELYLGIIHRRLKQAGWEGCRVHWIDIPGFNNAFVVGFKWFGFSNQTMFIGRSLRELLSVDEFDAVISHELGHMANGHLLKRITYGLSMVLGLVLSLVASLTLSILITLAVSDDPHVTAVVFGGCLLVTLIGSYLLLVTWLFRLYRQQEHEADAFAVMKLGIRLEDLENSLRKVARKFSEDARRRSPWSPFTTHPQIEERIENVRTKISLGVGYDWNQSPVSRLLEITIRAASPRTLAMSFSILVLTGLLTHSAVQRNRAYLRLVEQRDLISLAKFPWHGGVVNSRQYLLFGMTPLEMALHRADLEVVKFLISQGADPARGSGFSSPVDVAMSRAKWSELDYLLGELPDNWLENNASRLLRLAGKEESGEALRVVLAHRLQRWVPASEVEVVIERVAAQGSEAKMALLLQAKIWQPGRMPASVKNKKE